LETEFGGLFLEVGDAAGLSDRGLLEGFRFVVGHAAGDDRGEDAFELLRGGGEAFGFAQAGFHPTTILAVLVPAVAQGLRGKAQGRRPRVWRLWADKGTGQLSAKYPLGQD